MLQSQNHFGLLFVCVILCCLAASLFVGDLVCRLLVDDFALFDGVGVAVAVFQGAGEVEVYVAVLDVPEAVFVFGDAGEVGVDDAFFDKSPLAGSGLDDFAILGVTCSNEFVDVGGVILCLLPGRDLIPVPALSLICGEREDEEADDEACQQQDTEGTHQDGKADGLGERFLIGCAALRAGLRVVWEHRVAVFADRFPGGADAGAAGDRFDLVDLVLKDDRAEEVETKDGEEQRDDRIVIEHFNRLPDVGQLLRGFVKPVELIVRNEHDEQQLYYRTAVRFAPVAIRILGRLIHPIQEIDAEREHHQQHHADEVSHALRFLPISALVSGRFIMFGISCLGHMLFSLFDLYSPQIKMWVFAIINYYTTVNAK